MLKRIPLFPLAVVLVAISVFLFRLGHVGIVVSHEARLSLTAATMARSGPPFAAQPVPVQLGEKTQHVNPWIIPVFENAPRLHKPPLPYWCTATLFRLLGTAEFAARLLPALMGLAATFFLYALAKNLAGRSTARWAAVVWVSTLFVVAEYRKSMADPYLAFFTLTALWAWIAISRTPSAPPQPRSAPALAFAFYLSIALGLLSKGPVLLLHVLTPILLFQLIYHQRPRLRWTTHALGLLLVLALTLPWPLYIIANVPNVIEFWRFESVGEFADNRINARPWFFYLPALFEVALPWTPLWVFGIYLAIRRNRRPMRFALLWIASIVLFFSLAYVKKNAYLLPILPALTLVTARTLALACARVRRNYPHAWPKLLLDLQATLGLALGIAIAAMLLLGPLERKTAYTLSTLTHHWLTQASSRIADVHAPAALLALLAAFLPLHRAISRTLARRILVQAGVYAVLIALWLGFIDAERQNQRHRYPLAASPPPPIAVSQPLTTDH